MKCWENYCTTCSRLARDSSRPPSSSAPRAFLAEARSVKHELCSPNKSRGEAAARSLAWLVCFFFGFINTDEDVSCYKLIVPLASSSIEEAEEGSVWLIHERRKSSPYTHTHAFSTPSFSPDRLECSFYYFKYKPIPGSPCL